MRAIISFHGIDSGPGPLSFPAERLRMLLDALRAADLPVFDLDTLLAPGATRGVALTFDDGMTTVHSTALPILREHGVPAHLFLTTGAVGKDNRWPGQPPQARRYAMLNWNQIEKLHAGGVLVEGHTASHPDLRILSDPEIRNEMARADDEIEHRLGRRPRYFAYPYGFHDQRVREVAAGRYNGCVTTELRALHRTVKSDALPRIDSHYLRSPLMMRHLAGGAAQGYLALRRLLRQLRKRS